MAILPAWINIVLVLLHVTVIQGAGEPEFAASVPPNVLATFDGTTGSSSVTLPCTLSFTDPTIDPQNMTWRVDLTWFKREFGETSTTNLYIWENNYDDRIDLNETRMYRVKNPFEERYNLRFDDVRAEDEGEYCCYLHINTNPSSTACTNLHYKAFQDDVKHFIMDCDATDDPMTDNVECLDGSIPPMIVQINNFYPNIIQSEGRMVELYAPALDSSKPISTAEWTDFVDNADGTFNVTLNSTWGSEYECGKLGTVTFLISLTHKLEGDETYHTCTWIPQPPTTTEPPPTTEPPTTTEPPPTTAAPTTTEDTETTTAPPTTPPTPSPTTPKLTTPELPCDSPSKPKPKPCPEIWIIVVSVICGYIGGALLTCCIIIVIRNRQKKKKKKETPNTSDNIDDLTEILTLSHGC